MHFIASRDKHTHTHTPRLYVCALHKVNEIAQELQKNRQKMARKKTEDRHQKATAQLPPAKEGERERKEHIARG